MNHRSKTWSIFAHGVVTVLIMDRRRFKDAQATEVEIDPTLRQSQYFITKWAPPSESSSVELTIKNKDGIQHRFTSQFFENLRVRTFSNGVQVFGKDFEGLYLDSGATIQLGFSDAKDRNSTATSTCLMRGDLLVLHMDVV